MLHRFFPGVTAIALIGISLPTPAPAQVFIDVFAGRSLPERTAASITADEARINGMILPAQLRVEVESLRPTRSVIAGLREVAGSTGSALQ